jgi:hypothetical protein
LGSEGQRFESSYPDQVPVEQRLVFLAHNEAVVGSSPTRHTKTYTHVLMKTLLPTTYYKGESDYENGRG